MNKTLNRITTIFFFLLFFVLAPLLIFYAKGYRFNNDTNALEKNGAFYVKSFPRDATIYVDGKKTDKKTPTQIIDIRPDLHQLTVSKENYIDWIKELKVYPGETTFAEDIVLFLANRQKEILGTGSINHISNKKEDKYAYIDENNDLFITDPEQSVTVLLTNLDASMELLEWSYNNEKMLLADENNYYVFDINRKEISKLNLTKKEKVLWDTSNQNLFWILNNNSIYQYDISNEVAGLEKQDLKKSDFLINDFDIYENYLLIHYGDKENQFVDQIQKNDFEVKQTIKNVNFGQIKILLANDEDLIFILGSNLNIKNKDRDLISIPVTKAKIHDNRILITNGHEILLYNFKEDWQELIDRSSQIISDVIWHPNGSYFLSEIDGQTKITEIDGRDKRNSIDIYKNDLKKFYSFNKKGDKLFVLTPNENFYLTIQ